MMAEVENLALEYLHHTRGQFYRLDARVIGIEKQLELVEV
jgi:hypothetical protein